MNKFTKDDYKNAAKVSFSIAGMCRYLNLAPKGGNYSTIKKYIKEYEIDTSHFTGKGWNVGLKFKPHPQFNMEEILVKNKTYNTNKLRKRLIDEGYKEYKCECCGNTEWMGKPIPLELHHINGDRNDNRLENLQILCPNCHSFTENYRGSNKKKYKIENSGKSDIELRKNIEGTLHFEAKKEKEVKRSKKEKTPKYCAYCGKELIGKQKHYCSQECAHHAISKRPPVQELIEKIKEFNGNKCALGNYYGVSDKAIHKWINLYKL